MLIILSILIIGNIGSLEGDDLCQSDAECSRVGCLSPAATAHCDSGVCRCPPCTSNKDCPLPCPFPTLGHCHDGNCTCHATHFNTRCSSDSDCPLPCPFGMTGFCNHGDGLTDSRCECHVGHHRRLVSMAPTCNNVSECHISCPEWLVLSCDSGVCVCLLGCKPSDPCYLPCPHGQIGFCDAGICRCHTPCQTAHDCPLPCPYPMSGCCNSGSCKCCS
ncbi:multiple epidermal growth factor-like domains protein 11 [Ruditapes philippinarum]|uniref:multiple epidermal growth factor-like domains protein 11 n=1 Tax=Ruditapes philippinarum TaxID=129788 RepID=UPI00295BAB79|nr:multiple epidermal growth factor-like domains protein 11 [Ruditapes philippinarum]